MARVDMASLYRAVKREPKEGTIGEAVKCHAQACGFVAYIADVHPDEVARVVAGAKFADRPRRPRPRAHRTGGSMTDQRFTDEDRARVEALRDSLLVTSGMNHVGAGKDESDYYALARALAHITHLEGALMAAAWPIHAMGDDHPDMPEWAREPIKWLRDLQARADHLEGALEAADERLRIALTHPTPDRNLARAVESARAELARAALPTSKDD